MTKKTARARYTTALALALMLGGAWAEAAPAANGPTLQEISSASLPGGKVQIKLRHSAPPPAPLSFTIDNPARIVLDFADTAHSLAQSSQSVGIGAVRSVSVASAKGRTRVVLNLDQLVPYETRTDGNDVYLTLDASGGAAMAGADRATTAATAAKHSLSNIDFRRGEKGEARIIVSLSHPSTHVTVRKEGGQIIADFLNTGVPENLERRLDVVDFATPVKIVETSRHGNNTRMVITAQGEYEHLAYHAGNVFTIEVQPLTKTQQEVAEKKKADHSGERLSLNFQDIPVRTVLQLIADFTGQNLVASDKVTGNVTLRLQDVPWSQALDIILKSKGLSMRQTGSVLEIETNVEVAAREQLVPLRSESIRVNYAKATDLAAVLFKDEKNSLLSSRGKIAADAHSNTLLVQDTEDKLAEIRALVSALDVPQRQVMIESRIVIADDNFSKDMGVRFGVTGVRKLGDGIITSSGSASGTGYLVDHALYNLQSTGQPFPVGVPWLSDRLNVNLPVDGPRIAFAILGANILLDLELSALQAEKRGEVISNPRVVTVNQREAMILQGEEIPYVTRDDKGFPTTAFKLAGLSLKVTPQITPDNRIIMSIVVTKDARGAAVQDGGAPAIITNKVSTQVLVGNGETIVLGGVYEQITNNSTARVPFLGDLPYIGFLFKQDRKLDNKSELLIFVTPKILPDSLTLPTQHD